MAAVPQEQWSGESRGWRYLAQRLTRDGSSGPWLDNELPLTDVSFTDVLSGPTQLTATITPELTRLVAADGKPLLDEWGTAIYAEADGEIRAAAILVSSTWRKAIPQGGPLQRLFVEFRGSASSVCALVEIGTAPRIRA